MHTRRVVTGHNEQGKAVFTINEVVEPIASAVAPGYEFRRIWGADTIPEFPDAGQPRPSHDYFPPTGGIRFATFTVPPTQVVDLDDIDFEEAAAEMEERLPGLAGHMEPDNPGMHTTASIDFDYVVSGRVVLELDDGAAVELGPGDAVVQNGTRHAWRNPFDEPAVIVVTLIGTTHNGLPG